MKIALLGPVYPFRGGIAHYTTRLCRALQAAGHDVLMVSFRRQYPQRLFPGQSDRDPSQDALTVAEAHYWLDSVNPWTWLTTFGRIRAFCPEVVVLPWWTTFLAPVWLTLAGLQRIFLRKPLVIICHNVLPHEDRRVDRWIARAVLRWSTLLIVQSQAERSRLATLLPGNQLAIVPLPVFDMFVGEPVPREASRASLGLARDAQVLLFFGIVRGYKGLPDILEALPQIRAHLPRVRLLIAGEFWENKATYLEQIERLQIADLVTIDDRYIPNEEVPLYFGAADVLVAPYRAVTGSGVVQLAVGFNLPVVTTAEIPLLTAAERALIHITPRTALAQTIIDALAVPRQDGAGNTYVKSPDGWQALIQHITEVGSA